MDLGILLNKGVITDIILSIRAFSGPKSQSKFKFQLLMLKDIPKGANTFSMLKPKYFWSK